MKRSKGVLGIFIVVSVPTRLLSVALVSTVSVCSSSVCGLTCGQQECFGQASEHREHTVGEHSILNFRNYTFA